MKNDNFDNSYDSLNVTKLNSMFGGMSMFSSPLIPRGSAFLVNNLDGDMFKHNSTPTKPMPEKNTLDKANQTVNNDRQADYGDPVENAVRSALIATATQGKALTPVDIVQVMSAYKMVRSGKGKRHEDSNIDQAGYAEIRDRVQKAWDSGEIQTIVQRILGGWVNFPKDLSATVQSLRQALGMAEAKERQLKQQIEVMQGATRAVRDQLEKAEAALNIATIDLAESESKRALADLKVEDLVRRNKNQYDMIVKYRKQEHIDLGVIKPKEAARGTLKEPVRVITKQVACDDCAKVGKAALLCRAKATKVVTVTLEDADVTALTSSEFGKQYKLVEVK